MQTLHRKAPTRIKPGTNMFLLTNLVKKSQHVSQFYWSRHTNNGKDLQISLNDNLFSYLQYEINESFKGQVSQHAWVTQGRRQTASTHTVALRRSHNDNSDCVLVSTPTVLTRSTLPFLIQCDAREKEKSTKDLKMRKKEQVEEEKTGVSFCTLVKAMTQALEVAYTHNT